MPAVRLTGVRERHGLPVRKITSGQETVQVQDGQNHSAPADRTGAGRQTADGRQDGPAGEVHLEDGPSLFRLAGHGRERQSRLRISRTRLWRREIRRNWTWFTCPQRKL